MKLRILLNIFLLFVLSIFVKFHAAVDWNINLSLTLEDYDLDMESSLTLKKRNGLNIGDTAKAFANAGVKVQYKNQSWLWSAFSKIIFNRYIEIINPSNKDEKIHVLRHQLNTEFNYSFSSSELSLKILPRYHGDKNQYFRNLFFYNFLVRHYKCDAQGNWSFVGYETKDGDRSFEDFEKKNFDRSNKESIENLRKQLGSKMFEEQPLKIYKKGTALIMTHFSNENPDLRNIWTAMFESIKKNI